MKRFKTIVPLAVGMLLLVGCGTQTTEQVQAKEDTVQGAQQEEGTQAQKEATFTLEHTEDLVDKGYEPIVLDAIPQSVVTLSTAPVLALHALGIDLVAVPTTNTMTYPEDLDAEILPSAMSDDFDLEKIITLQPDLVMLPESSMAEHGKVLQDAGINVYAISMKGKDKTVYAFVKEQTQLFCEAFATDEASKQKATEVLARFDTLESRIEEVRAKYEGKTFLGVTVVDDTTFYAQTPTSMISSVMGMLGFENQYSEEMGSAQGMGSTAMLNLEHVVGIESDLVVFTTQMKTREESDAIVQSAIDANAAVWGTLPAVEAEKYVNLPASYIVTGGMKIIDSIESIMNILEEVMPN